MGVRMRGMTIALAFLWNALACSDQSFHSTLKETSPDGVPAIEVWPGALEFGPVEEAVSDTFEIRSTGDTTLAVTGLEVVGGDASFTLLDAPAGFFLEPGDVAEVQVVYQPSAYTLQEATVEVSSDADTSLLEVYLSGRGIEPPEPGEPPVAEIQSPFTGQVIPSSILPDLQGLVSDTEDAPEQLSAWWESDLDGALGTVTPDASGQAGLGAYALSVGEHTLTLTVEDTEGGQGNDQVQIQVCQMAEIGTLQVESAGHIVTTILSTDAGAVNSLYVIAPVSETITTDANNSVGVSVDLGWFEACTQVVFRLHTTAGNVTFDSNNSSNFSISRDGPDLWTVGVEDSSDFDYNDIIFQVEGGI